MLGNRLVFIDNIGPFKTELLMYFLYGLVFQEMPKKTNPICVNRFVK